jgi:uncharacterized protein DUF6438
MQSFGILPSSPSQLSLSVRWAQSTTIRMMIGYRNALLLLVLGDWRSAVAAQQTSGAPPLDSITFERSPCFGACPAYRLSLSRTGTVVFVSRYSGETIRDSIAPSAFVWLRDEAERRAVTGLPGVISRDRALCPGMWSDSPTATVTLYWPTRRYQIVDYLGCFAGSNPSTPPRLSALRRFETAIDSVARTARGLRRRLPSPPT